MSHFSVLVAIPGSEVLDQASFIAAVDAALLPYTINAGPEFEEFTDLTEKTATDYESDTADCVLFPDGTICTIFDRKFCSNFVSDGKTIYEHVKGASVITYRSKSLTLLKSYPIKKVYSLDKYRTEFWGLSQDAQGRWGTWNNPNTHCDWYEIGGRWSGLLIGHPEPDVIQASSRTNQPLHGNRVFLDGAKKIHIDWEYLRRHNTEDATTRYYKLKEAFDKKVSDGFAGLTFLTDEGVLDWDIYLYRDGETLEENLARFGLNDEFSVSAFAFIDLDGHWHEEGKMNMFGMLNDPMEKDVWRKKTQEFLASLSEDDYLAVVDCHI